MSYQEHPRYRRNKGTQTRRKKGRRCKRCKQRIHRCIAKLAEFFSGLRCCRGVNRRVMRNLCPGLESYEVGGHNLGSVASRINVVNLGAKLNVKVLDVLKNFSFTEVKRKFSIKGSKVNMFEKMIDDFKTGKLPELEIPSESNFDINKINKKQVNEVLEDYENMLNRAKENENLDSDELKEKFNITGSRAKILDKFVEDLRKEEPSVVSIATKRKFDPDNINKKQMRKILKKYNKDLKARKKRIKENEYLDADELKDKFSVYGSRAEILDAFVEDLKKGKKSTAGIPIKGRFDPNKITRQEMNEILSEYVEKSPELRKLYEKYRNLSFDDLRSRFSISRSKTEMIQGYLSRFI